MKITFLLPGFIKVPMGGVKVVNELAGRLAQQGHQVTLLYPQKVDRSILYRLKQRIVTLIDRINRVAHRLYYSSDPQVNVLVIRQPLARYIPISDAIIAVGWQTASWVNALPASHGKKYYYIQSFESYFKSRKQVLATYHFPLRKIAVSQWIINELQKIGTQAAGPLGNAVNPAEFYQTGGLSNRPYDVLMYYHPQKIKGARDGLRVLGRLKALRPECKAVIIAPRKPIHLIPKWVELYIRPPVRQLCTLYNRSKLLLHTSHWEGWALPPMEALACGCGVVAAKNQGVQEYLTHGKNVLFAEVGDIEGLTVQTLKLLDNDTLRMQLIQNGQQVLQKYTWGKIVVRFNHYLKEI